MLAELERKNEKVYIIPEDKAPTMDDPAAIFTVGLFKGFCEAMHRLEKR